MTRADVVSHVSGHGTRFPEGKLVLSALPYAIAACANLAGGAASDVLVRRLGVKRGRRSLVQQFRKLLKQGEHERQRIGRE